MFLHASSPSLSSSTCRSVHIPIQFERTMETVRNVVDRLRGVKSLNEAILDEAGKAVSLCLNAKEASYSLEEMLALVGHLMEAEEASKVLSENRAFINSLAQLIETFTQSHGILGIAYDNQTALSHKSYELSLYIMLGIAEKSANLKVALRVLGIQKVKELGVSLGSQIAYDTYYFTQERSLNTAVAFVLTKPNL